MRNGGISGTDCRLTQVKLKQSKALRPPNGMLVRYRKKYRMSETVNRHKLEGKAKVARVFTVVAIFRRLRPLVDDAALLQGAAGDEAGAHVAVALAAGLPPTTQKGEFF